VKTQQLGLRDLTKRRSVILFEMRRRPRCNVDSSRLSVYVALHNLRDHSAKRVSMTQPEGVGLAERLPHGRITLSGTIVRLHEHVPEEFDPIEFVDTQSGVGVKAARPQSSGSPLVGRQPATPPAVT
jgi:hypothetical protein